MNDEEAIVACALDYFEGWFDADSERMERALHPGLAKRSLADDGRDLDTVSAGEMIEWTSGGRGKALDLGDRQIEVKIDGIHDEIASARVHSAVYVDYLQLVKTADGWKIANALWKWSPEGVRIRDRVRGSTTAA